MSTTFMANSWPSQSTDDIELQEKTPTDNLFPHEDGKIGKPWRGTGDVTPVKQGSSSVLSRKNEILPESRTQAVLVPAPPGAPSRSPGPIALISAAVVIVISGGLAATLLIWLYTHRVTEPPQTWSTIWRNGTLVIDEGTETIEGLQRAKTVGLTISSATSHIISSTGPVICGVFAFNVADRFLRLSTQARQGRPSDLLPTPLQYGLLLSLCHSGTLFALGAIVFYLVKGSPKHVKASPLLIHAAAMVGLAYVLIHGVGLADFFLHKGTTTSEHTLGTSLPAAQYGWVFNASACGLGSDSTPLDGTKPNALNLSDTGFQGCNMGVYQWGESNLDETPFDKGYDELSNTSTFGQVALVGQGTSVFTPISADVHQSFEAPSISVFVACEIISDSCHTLNRSSTAGSCTSPTNFSFTGPNTLANLPAYDVWATLSNPISFAYIFGMATEDSPPSLSDALYAWIKPNGAMVMMMAACTANISNVTLSWDNGSYAVHHLIPTSDFITGSIFAPTWQTLQSTLLTNQIGALAYSAPTVADLQDGLGNIFATGILQRAIGLVMPTNTTSLSSISTGLVTQYPIIPLIVLVSLLTLYALLAFFVTVAAMTASAPPLLVREPAGKSTSVSALALAQRSIVSPLGIVAAFLAHDGDDVARAHASVSPNNQSIFAASEPVSHEPVRVIVGLGGSRVQPSFGVWRLDHGEDEKEGLLALTREVTADTSYEPENLYDTGKYVS